MNELLLKSSVSDDLCLQSVLLNLNLRAPIPRRVIDIASLHRFQTRVAVGELDLKLACGECRLMADIKDGNALLHLWRGRQAMAVAGVATNSLGAADLWQFLLDLEIGDSGWGQPAGMPEPERPSDLPWLAVNLSPAFMADADPQKFRQVSKLFWVLGWAVVEHVAEQQRRN